MTTLACGCPTHVREKARVLVERGGAIVYDRQGVEHLTAVCSLRRSRRDFVPKVIIQMGDPPTVGQSEQAAHGGSPQGESVPHE